MMKTELKPGRIDLNRKSDMIEPIMLCHRFFNSRLPLELNMSLLECITHQSGGKLSINNGRHFKSILNRINLSVNWN